MYAYCGNNPVLNADASGAYHRPFMYVTSDQTGPSSEETKKYIEYLNYNPENSPLAKTGRYLTNTSEDVVLNSTGLAFYKGVPVIIMPNDSTASFSFVVIFLGGLNKSDPSGATTLRHEYGHSVHLSQIGIPSYTVNVVAPSLIGFWSDVPYNQYYSQPWEYIADFLGEANRTLLGKPYPYSHDSTLYALYWMYTLLP